MLLPSQKKKILEELSKGIKPDNFPSETVRSITDLSLNRHGQVKLSAFPDFILKKALQQTRSMSNLKDPFSYLFSRCVLLCREQSITPDFAWVDSLKKTLKITNDQSCVLLKPSRSVISVKNILDAKQKTMDLQRDIDPSQSLIEAEQEMRSMAQKNPGLAFIFGDLFANIEKQKQ